LATQTLKSVFDVLDHIKHLPVFILFLNLLRGMLDLAVRAKIERTYELKMVFSIDSLGYN